MNREDRQRLRTIITAVSNWNVLASNLRGQRVHAWQEAERAAGALVDLAVAVNDGEAAQWATIPLGAADLESLRSLAIGTQLAPFEPAQQAWLNRLETETPKALADAKPLLGMWRAFSGQAKKDLGVKAADFLTRFHQWSREEVDLNLFTCLAPPAQPRHPATAERALADDIGLAAKLASVGLGVPALFERARFGDLQASVAAISTALQGEGAARSAAKKAGDAVRDAETRAFVAAMPLDRLKDATRDRLRIGPLRDAGFRTVLEVLDRKSGLEGLPGIGEASAQRLRGAARTLWQTTYDEMPVRINIAKRTPATTELLRRLAAWDSTRRVNPTNPTVMRARALTPFAAKIRSAQHVVVAAADGRTSALDLLDRIDAVNTLGRSLGASSGARVAADPWDDFLGRPADYFALLSELGFDTEDAKKAHGDLPQEIIDAVRALRLNTEHLRASLRGYQSFGARFALVQRKVIIGDEMGLGKTVEAIAVLAHLRGAGKRRFVVVCPAAVVTNWMREIAAKSDLPAYRVHGLERDRAMSAWARNQGVAVTTFETLAVYGVRLGADVDCVVVDEAHYVKNPGALRSQRVATLVAKAEHALLLTGTPLENRIEEFRNLVRYVQPRLANGGDHQTAKAFRTQVAPSYLRRNQEDVLTELPELVEIDEWLPMSPSDERTYRAAVLSRNFMAMRQAAMTSDKESAKVQRLLEIVEESKANGRKLLVFSHFREVLDRVARLIPGAIGPLTGSVSAAARQDLVDRFTKAPDGAVLVSQIVAGGVGLNVQAASVVVICEPQLKPTVEWQAIARAHRMGQLNSVQVHRLLSETGADRRITEILEGKKRLFEEFARVSETAHAAPEAFDVSEADLARQVVEEERERLMSQPEVDEPVA